MTSLPIRIQRFETYQYVRSLPNGRTSKVFDDADWELFLYDNFVRCKMRGEESRVVIIPLANIPVITELVGSDGKEPNADRTETGETSEDREDTAQEAEAVRSHFERRRKAG